MIVVLGLVAVSCTNGPFGDSTLGSNQAPSESQTDESDTEVSDSNGSAGGTSEGGSIEPGKPELDVSAFNPKFEERACDDSLPNEIEFECGVVAVPSNWETGEGEIELSVAVVKSDADSSSGPIINLEGGPGGHSIETVAYVVEDVVEPLLETGDVIFFDQRGVGLSSPRLSCAELTELAREHEDERSLDDDEATEQFYQALTECRDRLLGEGNVLEDYNSINNAHDVEAIRLALDYDEWNLLGVSYGTKLALEVMRQHPGHVRSAILDSVYPPQVDSALENPSTFIDSYNKVVDACADEPECAAGGDLGQRLQDLMAELEQEPIRVEIEDWVSGDSDTIFVDGDTLAGVVTSSLYSTSQFVDLPEVVEQLENGESDGLATFLSQDRTGERFFTSGMFYAVACQEEISFSDPEAVAEALPDDPFGLDDKFNLASNTGPNAFKTCAAFENGTAPESSNIAVTSDISTLVMAGDFDPVTPTAWAALAAETLPNSYLVVAKNGSHGISGGECGSAIVTKFLVDPTTAPDASCLDDETLSFVASSPDGVELEDFSFEISNGRELKSVRPKDWRIGSLEGDQYRDASFLDPTVFFQLSADDDLTIGLERYVETSDLTLSGARTYVGSAGPFDASELDRTWKRRQGTSNGVRVEWFETTIDGQPVQIIMVTSDEEYEANMKSIMLPALQGIQVS